MQQFYQEIIQELKKKELSSSQLAALKRNLCTKYHLKKIPTNIEILLNVSKKDLLQLKPQLLTKPTRSISGVAPIAIMTKPFPCPHALNGTGPCTMCPGGLQSNFGDVPQSYTGREPATLRGIRNLYDPYLQVFNRLEQYVLLGHNCEKVELILMGGTFPSFPLDYQEDFVKYAFKAMNDFSKLFYTGDEFDFLKFKKFFSLPALDLSDQKRVKQIQEQLLQLKGTCNLESEQKKNETSIIRCVAMCIETRPDYGLLKHGQEMLRLGCTRVEIGIQSVYDRALKRIKRSHTTKDTIKSLRILKDLGFKVAAHYMPGLPGINLKDDLAGMKKLFSDPDYRPDMLKIYPCMVTKGTELYQEYLAGKFQPLTAESAAKLIAQFKKYVPEYCRIMRVQRDIPTFQIAAGVEMTNLRQYLHQKHQPHCRCIRCREPKNKKISWDKVKLQVKKYKAAKGQEFFISFNDTENDLLLGFCRLRFPSQFLRQEITTKSALIRELHVYGTAVGLGGTGSIQHKGLGIKLIQAAEQICRKQGKNKLIIISGIGVREYYKNKVGYSPEGPYMVKELKP